MLVGFGSKAFCPVSSVAYDLPSYGCGVMWIIGWERGWGRYGREWRVYGRFREDEVELFLKRLNDRLVKPFKKGA